MSLALGLVDNSDGTGGVASVTGSDGGSSNTLYSAPFAGGTGPLTWTSRGSRTGDGTIAISESITTAKYYQWMVTGTVSSAPAFASYFRALTNAAYQAVSDRCGQAIAQGVATLNLTDIQAVNINRKWLPKKLEGLDPTPQVQVVPVGGEGFPGTLTGQDDITYDHVVLFIDNQAKDFVKNMSRNLLWREQVLSHFRFQRLAGVNESVIVEPGQQTIINAEAFAAGYFLSICGLKCRNRQSRG